MNLPVFDLVHFDNLAVDEAVLPVVGLEQELVAPRDF